MRQAYRPKVAKTRTRPSFPRPITEFLQSEANSGVLLMVCAVVALFWANSPWAESYEHFWHTPVAFAFGDSVSSKTLVHWINDGLMALFFLFVGLEIKRELLIGELSSVQKAALPVVAALGGMIVPALIFTSLNAGLPTSRGWGVPMATDIAFPLGVITLLGSRIPFALKVFLAAIAIVDDLGAVLVIALFYTSELSIPALTLAATLLIVLVIVNQLAVRSPLIYLALGFALWLAVLQSGVHATIAGVLLAMTIPTRVHLHPAEFLQRAREALREFERSGHEQGPQLMTEERQSAVHELEQNCERVQMPLERIENALGPWVRYLIMPLFALANAGVNLGGGIGEALSSRVALGVLLGLLIGKPIGITLFCWLAVKLKLAALPDQIGWWHIAGMGLLAGIGFTMSLFIGELAFADAEVLRSVKLAVLTASVLAGVVGYLWLRASPRRRTVQQRQAAKAAS